METSSAWDPDPDPLDPQDFGFLDPDPDPQKYKNMRIHGSGSKSQNINQKLQQKKILLSKAKSKLLKKRDLKNFLISEWFIKFYHKNKRKK